VLVCLKAVLTAYYSGNIAQGVCKETLAVNETGSVLMVYLTKLSVP
jgi:hypothetical protein